MLNTIKLIALTSFVESLCPLSRITIVILYDSGYVSKYFYGGPVLEHNIAAIRRIKRL